MKSKTIISRKLDINNDSPKQQQAPFFDSCPKFHKKYDVKFDLDRIVSYIDFSQKRICKFDSTQIKDGLPSAKLIQISPNDSIIVNDWTNVGGELNHQFNNRWKTNIQDICIDKNYQDQLDNHFKAKVTSLKHDYKAKIEYMNKYFQEIDRIIQVFQTLKEFRSKNILMICLNTQLKKLIRILKLKSRILLINCNQMKSKLIIMILVEILIRLKELIVKWKIQLLRLLLLIKIIIYLKLKLFIYLVNKQE
ncbi:unnamed protein product [Paramecium primaurelia]|uniref:Uncharacterized protein n=1 Tax=Paramecium primaurelia TaxID=5886 RepID=A0A8S1MQ81_PARPR|nr:unnamed protein product [Paramecium primaurelia]